MGIDWLNDGADVSSLRGEPDGKSYITPLV